MRFDMRCKSKATHKTRLGAIIAIKKTSLPYGHEKELLTIYKCKKCGYYHVGKKRESIFYLIDYAMGM